MFYLFENIKNSITIVFSSYFHIFETRVGYIPSCTCISKNVFKCILKHSNLQYYAMKSKKFLLLIIKIKKIHKFNVLRLNIGFNHIIKTHNHLFGVLFNDYLFLNIPEISFSKFNKIFKKSF
jgi:hypothetical protein